MSDKQIAAQLNRLGIETAKGHTWTRVRVGNFRTIHEIPNYSPGEREARGELTLEEAATRLGVSYSTMQRMIRRRQVPAQAGLSRWAVDPPRRGRGSVPHSGRRRTASEEDVRHHPIGTSNSRVSRGYLRCAL